MTAPQDAWPDAADPHDEALAQLREPTTLLAEALTALRDVQAIGRTIELAEGWVADPKDRRDRLTDEALLLIEIAKAASEIAAQERQAMAHAIDAGLDELDALTRGDPGRPKAINGVRFVAELRGVYLGAAGHVNWLHVPHFGYLDVTATDARTDESGTVYTMRGTVKSTTAHEIIGVTDGGYAVTLPIELVTLGPDE